MTESLYHLDVSLLHSLNSFVNQSVWGNGLIVFFATYLPFVLVGGFAFYIFRLSGLTPRQQNVALVLSMFAAFIARIGITSPIRFFFPRERPFVALDVQDLFVVSSSSFPSGHAAFFFAFSTIVFFYNRTLGIVSFILTTLVCAARVAAGVHYPTDIFGGLVVGVFAGYITLYLYKRLPILYRTRRT